MDFPSSSPKQLFHRKKKDLEVTSARQAARQGNGVNTFNQLAKQAHGIPRSGAWGSFQKSKCAEEGPFLGPVGKGNRHRPCLWWNGILMLLFGQTFEDKKSRICRSGWFGIAILVSNVWFWHLCTRFLLHLHFTFRPFCTRHSFHFIEPARSFLACHPGIADCFCWTRDFIWRGPPGHDTQIFRSHFTVRP